MSQHQLRRRELIQGGAAALFGAGMSPALGASLPFGSEQGMVSSAASRTSSAESGILLLLVGGPSQLDTWDPKPDTETGVRSPFRPIRTNVPGIEVSELFSRMARHADKYALIRSCYHSASPVHDLGHQLVQTGRLSTATIDYPHIGCVLQKLKGSRNELPGNVWLGGEIGATGGNLSHGQGSGLLNLQAADIDQRKLAHAMNLGSESDGMRARYGDTPFGRDCLRARRLVEAGVRFVTVNMFQTVFGTATWDTHGWEPFASMKNLRDDVAPAFDRAYTALLTDLSDRGMLPGTLVAATGEFGRTPKRNTAGGRDHWPQCWTSLLAGGGVRGGQVIGASDRSAAEPAQRPVSAAELVATLYYAFGVPPSLEIASEIPLLDPEVEPVREVFS